MRIIIAGAGKLGFSIAQLLAEDQFDVVVVEIDPKRKEVVQNSLDVLAIEGNSCSPTIFADPDVRDADVIIACTDSDEVNMVTCLLAKKNGIKHTVARIRNVDYAVHAPEMLNNDMKIDLVINPERITAVEIDHILMTPSALNVDEFAEGKVRMFEAKIKEDSPLINIPLKDLQIPQDILMAMVFRRHRMIIPRGNDYVMPGDNVYFVGKHEAIREFENSFGNIYDKQSAIMRKIRFWRLCRGRKTMALPMANHLSCSLSIHLLQTSSMPTAITLVLPSLSLVSDTIQQS